MNVSRMLIIIGILMLAAGAWLSFAGGPPKADPAMIASCQERVKDQGAAMAARCQEASFATAMTATDANVAARAISAANNQEIGSNAIGMFALGLGLVITLAGLFASRKPARRVD